MPSFCKSAQLTSGYGLLSDLFNCPMIALFASIFVMKTLIIRPMYFKLARIFEGRVGFRWLNAFYFPGEQTCFLVRNNYYGNERLVLFERVLQCSKLLS